MLKVKIRICFPFKVLKVKIMRICFPLFNPVENCLTHELNRRGWYGFHLFQKELANEEDKE